MPATATSAAQRARARRAAPGRTAQTARAAHAARARAAAAALPGKTTPVELLRVRHRMDALVCLRDHGPLSRIELCERLGQSAATMTKVVAELAGLGWLSEGDVRRSGELGRPRTALVLNAQRSAVLVLLAEPHALTTARIGLDLALTAVQRRPLALAGRSPARTLELLRAAAARELARASEHGEPIDGVVVVAAGTPDASLRTSRRSVPLGWSDLALADGLEPHLALPVFVHNNTRAMALAEFRHLGLGMDEPLLFVQARFGLGAALVNSAVPGQRGPYGVAELGHVPLAVNGFAREVPTDTRLASVLGEAYLRAVLRLPDDGDEPPVPLLEARAAAGDARAQRLLAQTLDNLATALGVAVDMLAPSVVVLGGLYAEASDRFIDDLRAALASRAQPELLPGLRLQRSALGSSGALQGGAIVAFDRLLRRADTYHPRLTA